MEYEHCECMIDSKEDSEPKVYSISYKIYGVDHKNILHNIASAEGALVVAINAEDVIDQLKRDFVNVEFNHTDSKGMIHIVGQTVYVESIEYYGPLAGISVKSLDYLSDSPEDNEDEI